MFDEHDNWVSPSEDIQNIFQRFYLELFSSDGIANS